MDKLDPQVRTVLRARKFAGPGGVSGEELIDLPERAQATHGTLAELGVVYQNGDTFALLDH
jgi:hypothetical protein